MFNLLQLVFVQGRALLNAIGNLELIDAYAEALSKLGSNLESVSEQIFGILFYIFFSIFKYSWLKILLGFKFSIFQLYSCSQSSLFLADMKHEMFKNCYIPCITPA